MNIKYIRYFDKEEWTGEGNHHNFSTHIGSIFPFPAPDDSLYTYISETRNDSRNESTIKLVQKIGYPAKNLLADPTEVTNQSYRITLGESTFTGTVADASITTVFDFRHINIPDSEISVIHRASIIIPYSFRYTADLKIDQKDLFDDSHRYVDFSVVLEYSGTFDLAGFYDLYGSVNGTSKGIEKLYGSVGQHTKEIMKLYASVGGVSKRIY